MCGTSHDRDRALLVGIVQGFISATKAEVFYSCEISAMYRLLVRIFPTWQVLLSSGEYILNFCALDLELQRR